MFDNVDAIVLLSEVNRFYFSGINTSSGCVILTPTQKIFITDFRYIEIAKKSLEGWTVVMHTTGLYAQTKIELEKLAPKAIGFEDGFVSVAMFEKLKGIFGTAITVPVSERLALKRAVKTEEEISKIAAAQVIAQKSLSKVVSGLKPGITEREMSAEIMYEMQMLGAEKASFDIIVAFGASSAMPHYCSGAKRLEKNDIILVDMGAKLGGYCSDMTRTFSIGDVGKKLEQLHALVLEGQLMGIKAIKSGITGREADMVVREFFRANGFDKEFGHSLGHGVGIDIHEYPNLSALSENVLEPNMIVTIEPGLYIEGIGGVRIEDMVVVKENGCLNLTNMSKNLYL